MPMQTCWRLFYCAVMLIASELSNAQQVLPLYEGDIPGAIAVPDAETLRDPKEPYPFLQNVSRPEVTLYKARIPDARRAAVVILPGGSYRGVSIVKEGHDVARAFNDMGVTALVVKYRTPSERHMKQRWLGPLQDAQRALALVRERAGEWGIDQQRVGLIGFSAGGHLAATVATHFDRPADASLHGVNLRPDFLMLIYPVISLTGELAHTRSRDNLLGPSAPEAMTQAFSLQHAVRSDMPPTFLVHTADDSTVPVGNSIRFFEALHANGIATQLFIYPTGGHGFGLNNPTTTDRWIDRCKQWLLSQGWIGKREGDRG
jgi:acetyl esterase/lipase